MNRNKITQEVSINRLRKKVKNNAMEIALGPAIFWDVLGTLYRASFFRVISFLQLFPDKTNIVLIEAHQEAGESWFDLQGKG